MTSLARKMARSNPNYEPYSNPQLTEFSEDSGYKTLHPTKGWQNVSGARVSAREKMMQMFGFIR